MQWSYVFLALTHRIVTVKLCVYWTIGHLAADILDVCSQCRAAIAHHHCHHGQTTGTTVQGISKIFYKSCKIVHFYDSHSRQVLLWNLGCASTVSQWFIYHSSWWSLAWWYNTTYFSTDTSLQINIPSETGWLAHKPCWKPDVGVKENLMSHKRNE